ncbi:MAG: hypothetical protein J4428_01545 [Candidatus Aenigmarchaeota archaeon]|nr:hypothetical protein [Candidatus Aenigmarchaeota archaeon]
MSKIKISNKLVIFTLIFLLFTFLSPKLAISVWWDPTFINSRNITISNTDPNYAKHNYTLTLTGTQLFSTTTPNVCGVRVLDSSNNAVIFDYQDDKDTIFENNENITMLISRIEPNQNITLQVYYNSNTPVVCANLTFGNVYYYSAINTQGSGQNFEDNSMSQWNIIGGSASVDSNSKLDGTYSLKCGKTGGSNQCDVWRRFTNISEVNTSVEFSFLSPNGDTNSWFCIGSGDNNCWTNIANRYTIFGFMRTSEGICNGRFRIVANGANHCVFTWDENTRYDLRVTFDTQNDKISFYFQNGTAIIEGTNKDGTAPNVMNLFYTTMGYFVPDVYGYLDSIKWGINDNLEFTVQSEQTYMDSSAPKPVPFLSPIMTITLLISLVIVGTKKISFDS